MHAATHEKAIAAIEGVPGWCVESAEARPLVGGLLNSNWLVETDGRKYFMKVPGVGSEEFVDRRQANHASVLAHAAGISPEVIHFDPESGVEVSEFLSDYVASTNADFVRRDFQEMAIDLYRRFNACASLPVTKDIFEMTDEHIEQGTAHGAIRPPDFDWLLFQYGRAKQAFLAAGLDLTPCHNDPMPGNFLVKVEDGRLEDMKLVDFEFASNNERAYEIGVFLGEMFVDEPTTLHLIERFYGESRPELVARVMIARAVADMKWGSWAVAQRQVSGWDFDYQKYGIWKYARARVLFEDPRWNDWLKTI